MEKYQFGNFTFHSNNFHFSLLVSWLDIEWRPCFDPQVLEYHFIYYYLKIVFFYQTEKTWPFFVKKMEANQDNIIREDLTLVGPDFDCNQVSISRLWQPKS